MVGTYSWTSRLSRPQPMGPCQAAWRWRGVWRGRLFRFCWTLRSGLLAAIQTRLRCLVEQLYPAVPSQSKEYVEFDAAQVANATEVVGAMISKRTRKAGTATFTVTGLTRSGLTYDPANNLANSGSVQLTP